MNTKKVKYLAAAVCILMVSGCADKEVAADSVASVEISNEFLDLSNETISAQGKWDFESLIFNEDDSTKRASYNLPENIVQKYLPNKVQFIFYLNRFLIFDEYLPKLDIQYSGDKGLFIKSLMIKIDNDVIELQPSYDVYRQTLTPSGVFEFAQFELDRDTVNFFARSKSKSDLSIRIIAEMNLEPELTKIEYKGMKKVLSAYRYYLNTP